VDGQRPLVAQLLDPGQAHAVEAHHDGRPPDRPNRVVVAQHRVQFVADVERVAGFVRRLVQHAGG